MSTGSQNTVTSQVMPDVNETGRVLAELDDWRAITFVLVFVILIQLIDRFWSQREMRLERQSMKDLANNFAESATKVAEALGKVRTEMKVLRILASRIESVSAGRFPEEDEG